MKSRRRRCDLLSYITRASLLFSAAALTLSLWSLAAALVHHKLLSKIQHEEFFFFTADGRGNE